MLKIDISNLIFSKSFLDLKYKSKSIKAIKNLQRKYNEWKLDFLRVSELVNTKKINDFVDENKNKYENIVVLWIWWSALWTKAIFYALKWKYYNELNKKDRNNYPKLYILDNIDPEEIDNLLSVIDLSKTLFLVISKSGSTIETLSLYNFFKNQFKKDWLNYKKHFVIIAWENSNFKKNSKKEWLKVFDIPTNIWGRFSVFTPVWLLPLWFVWIDIDLILKWVDNIKKSLLLDDTSKNLSLLTSIINYHSYVELWKNILVLFPYSTNLYFFWEWYKQLLAESLWKWWLGLTPTTSIWVTDQHSQLQLYYDGPNDKILNFIEVKKTRKDYPIIDNFSFKNLLDIEKYATVKSITEYNKINYTLILDELKEETIWELIVMYETQIAIMAEFLWVNAFDQPWVEIWKKIAKEKIKKEVWSLDFLDKNNIKNITFIWWWNWQSSILALFKEYLLKVKDIHNVNYKISSIVAMSDDWRTTWLLMKIFKNELGKHLPPPWDLRRILFTLSNSSYKDFFSITFNKVFNLDKPIKDFTILDLFKIISRELIEESRVFDLKNDILEFLEDKWAIYDLLNNLWKEILNFKLPLKASLKWHKFWNILMANLYYNFWYNYDKMLDYMKKILEVEWEVLPVTIDEAKIKAILQNWEIVETQDKISNEISYKSNIKRIEFLEWLYPKITNKIKSVLKKSDYIIITPGDLYTSIIANFIIDWFIKELENTDAKIIYILNANNKNWETTWYKVVNFVEELEKYLWNKNIDYLFWNKQIPELSKDQLKKFKDNISVKGWEYLIITDKCKIKLLQKYKKLKIIRWEYINSKDLYKYNENLIKDLINILK